MQVREIKLKENFCLKFSLPQGISCYFVKVRGNRYYYLRTMGKDPIFFPTIAKGFHCCLQEDGAWLFSGKDDKGNPVTITISNPCDWKEFNGISFIPINALEYFSF